MVSGPILSSIYFGKKKEKMKKKLVLLFFFCLSCNKLKSEMRVTCSQREHEVLGVHISLPSPIIITTVVRI